VAFCLSVRAQVLLRDQNNWLGERRKFLDETERYRIKNLKGWGGGVGVYARNCTPQRHVARTELQVHYVIQLGYRGTAEIVTSELCMEVVRKRAKGRIFYTSKYD
jgi:hypothetical protein